MAEFRTLTGGRVDRAKPVNFTFDGVAYTGLRGDTLASALIANGVHLMGRSFKYHRPRGLLSMGVDEPNALVNVSRGGGPNGGRSLPNVRASQVELYEGLAASSQNRWPSLQYDVGEVNNLLSPVFAAGFYYKTFMWPKAFWHKVYEPVIRHAAGLGVAPKGADPDHYANRFAHCDVLVIGAGPAGLTAALAAAEAGADVIICDEGSEFGGSLLGAFDETIDGREGSQWPLDLLMVLAMHDKIRALPRTTAFGYYSHNFVGLSERLTDHQAQVDDKAPRERLWQVRAKQVVLATGAIERPMVFADNDRPGIMLASAARVLLNRYGVTPGKKGVLFTATDEAYQTAIELHAAGCAMTIIDLRANGGVLAEKASAAGLRVELGATITGTKGRLRVSSVSIGKVDGETVMPAGEIECDCVLMAGGWTPNVSLFSQSRGKLKYDASGVFLPDVAVQDQFSVGACAGTFGLEDCLNGGYAAGEAAARACGYKGGVLKTFDALGDVALSAGVSGATPNYKDPKSFKAFVDFQNDVTARDIRLATREGMHSIEHVKRYTTTGMASDQGKTSNMNGLAIAAKALNSEVPQVGLTTFRAPYTPVTFGAFAGLSRGNLFDPTRKTAIHDWVAEHGAKFEDVGQWKRAWYFGSDLHAATNAEVKQVRQTAGIFDASTLGKIEVVGPDAWKFLNRMYTGAFEKLAVGRCRYGLLLNEAGFVIDDGVIARIAQDRFHVTTTTGGAARVLNMMEDYLQTEFTDLACWLTSITEQFAVIAVQGPKARDILAPLVEGIDLNMPHMSVALGKICGVPTRLWRVSFTGELGFEVNVPADYGRAIWEAIWAEGQKHGACAYGTEAMHVLRAEKGYIIVGQDTDGTVTPDDLGLGGMISRLKPDFVGKRGLAMPDLTAPGRKQLVGLLTANPLVVLEEGAQITVEPRPAPGTKAVGHVTSSYWSETLGRSIALALVENGRARMDETLNVPMENETYGVRVVEPVFFDKSGERLNG